MQEATYTRRPRQVTAADVTHLEQAASTLRRLDLRHGGELTCQMAGHLLRWAVNQRTAAMTAPVRHRWHAALATLAMWGAWSAHDACQRPGARAFAVLALDAAARADEPDLRAHALADIAAQHNHHAAVAVATRSRSGTPTTPCKPCAWPTATSAPRPRCSASCTGYAPAPMPRWVSVIAASGRSA